MLIYESLLKLKSAAFAEWKPCKTSDCKLILLFLFFNGLVNGRSMDDKFGKKQ